MRYITDNEEKKYWLNTVNEIFDRPNYIKESYLTANNFAAIPFERGIIRGYLAKKVSDKLNSIGVNKIYSIPVEGGDELDLFEINNLRDEIKKASIEIFSFFYIVIPSNMDFIFFNSPEDYQVLAGPKKLVEELINMDILSARKEFLEYADDKFWNEYDKKIFSSVASYYEKFNG